MKKVMILTLVFGLSKVALAQAATSTSFSYAQAAQAFQAGVEATDAQLNGSWKMVGLAVPGTDPDQYNASGLTNSDGSFLDELTIQLTTDALTGGQQLSVGVDGLGAASSVQGPFTASLDTTGLKFETYGYTGGCLDTSITFPRVCKLVKLTGALVCHMDDSNDSTVDYADEYDVYVHE